MDYNGTGYDPVWVSCEYSNEYPGWIIRRIRSWPSEWPSAIQERLLSLGFNNLEIQKQARSKCKML
jgi:hypothetical protein